MMVLVAGTGGTADEFTALQRALNGSTHPMALPQVPTVADAVDGVEHAVSQVSGPVVLVGHSAGGVVAAAAAARMSWLTDLIGLVLLDANMPADAEAVRNKQSRFNGETPSRQTFLRAMSDSVGDGTDALIRQTVMARMTACADTQVRARFWPDVLAQDTAQLWRQLGAARIPTLYVRSTRPVDLTSVRRLHPRAQLAEISGAGHWMHLTRPGKVAAAIQRFVRDLTAASPR